jgi:two-component system, chemotaxis family, chemotaxis protein CheY
MKQILIVDDSKTMRDMVSFTLKEAGYSVTEAIDGQDAVGKSDNGKFDCVITDVNMPNMDGITLTTTLRKKSQFASIPILILTTEADQTKRDAGKNAGATGWIVKPFNPEKLIQVVKKVCP